MDQNSSTTILHYVPSSTGKLNQYIHEACHQGESSSVLRFHGRWQFCFLEHTGPTAHDIAPQQLEFCPSLRFLHLVLHLLRVTQSSSLCDPDFLFSLENKASEQQSCHSFS